MVIENCGRRVIHASSEGQTLDGSFPLAVRSQVPVRLSRWAIMQHWTVSMHDRQRLRREREPSNRVTANQSWFDAFLSSLGHPLEAEG